MKEPKWNTQIIIVHCMQKQNLILWDSQKLKCSAWESSLRTWAWALIFNSQKLHDCTSQDLCLWFWWHHGIRCLVLSCLGVIMSNLGSAVTFWFEGLIWKIRTFSETEQRKSITHQILLFLFLEFSEGLLFQIWCCYITLLLLLFEIK